MTTSTSIFTRPAFFSRKKIYTVFCPEHKEIAERYNVDDAHQIAADHDITHLEAVVN